jgi:transposase
VPHVTRQGTGRVVRALGMICLCVRGGAGLVPAVGLIRSLSALWGVTHHSLAARFPCTQTGVNRTLRVKPEDQRRCLQIRWTTWSVSTRTETSTRWRLWSRQPVSLWGSGRCVRADAGTRRRGVSQSSRPVLASGRSKVLATTVLEIGRGPRDERRLQGKDDSLDAIRAARTALASKTLALPRAGQRREALRLLLLARRSAVDVRRLALVQLRSVIVTAPDPLREELRALPVQRLIVRCSRLHRTSSAPADELATKQVLRSLARRIQAATSEAAELEREILSHVRALAAQLLDEPGVGPIVAAQLIVSWSHHGRVRSEAAFARLAGAAPIPASSGQTTRHRLSRGGDRQLNRALHTVILHRRQHDAATKDYIARRIAEGKTRRDATRLLKRYLARHLYRLLEHGTPSAT